MHRIIFVALSLGLAGSAWAKDEEPDTIEMTGIEAFDSVFERVATIDGQLTAVDKDLRTAKTNLNTALALKKGTPIVDGLAELQARAGDKLQLTLDSRQVPKLTVTDAVPSNVQSAVDAVNALTGDLTSSLTTLQALGPEVEQLVKQTGKFPARLKDEFKKDSGSIIDQIVSLPKVSKTLTNDLKITAGLPERTASLTTRVTDILGVVQTEFGKGGTPAPAPASRTRPVPTKK